MANGKNLMRKIKISVYWVIAIILIGILIWALWPAPLIHTKMRIKSESLFPCDRNCDLKKIFSAYQFNVIHPRYLNFGQSFFLKVVMERVETSDDLAQLINDLAIKMVLKTNTAMIEPGEEIIQPLEKVSKQIIRFEILPRGVGKLWDGLLWIYMLIPSESSGSFEAIPLFAVPLEIEMRSFFGMPINAATMISICGLVGIGIMCLRKKGK